MKKLNLSRKIAYQQKCQDKEKKFILNYLRKKYKILNKILLTPDKD